MGDSLKRIHQEENIVFINAHLDSTVCNLKCSYCYVAQRPNIEPRISRIKSISDFSDGISSGRIGGKAIFNICASGETLLHPDIVPLVETIIRNGHIVSVVTNGTISKTFDEMVKRKVDMEKIFFKFSFHYIELVRTNNLQVFIDNVNKVRVAGASFTIEIVGSDVNIPYQEEIKKVSQEAFGAIPHVTIPRDDRTQGIDLMSRYPLEEYTKIWDSFDSELFRIKVKVLYKKIADFCLAGKKSIYMDVVSGNISKCLACPAQKNVYDTSIESLLLDPIGNDCPLPYCYNGHVYLTMGLVKEIDAPTYFDVRNRVTPDGSNWVHSTIADVFKRKLYED